MTEYIKDLGGNLFECSECYKLSHKPLEIKHSKLCSTPTKIKIETNRNIKNLRRKTNNEN